MTIAELTATLSHCNKLKVGAVIVRDNNILATGYNQTPIGFDNCCEDENGKTKDIVIHAERNALMRMARSTESSVGANMFITHSPCKVCCAMIISSGIKTLYYGKEYRDPEGIELLKQAGIHVERLEI